MQLYFFLILGGIVYAYNAAYPGAVPGSKASIMGHTADEIDGGGCILKSGQVDVPSSNSNPAVGYLTVNIADLGLSSANDYYVLLTALTADGQIPNHIPGPDYNAYIKTKTFDSFEIATNDNLNHPYNVDITVEYLIVKAGCSESGGGGSGGSFSCQDYTTHYSSASPYSGDSYCSNLGKVCVGVFYTGSSSYAEECSLAPNTNSDITIRCCSG